VLDRGVRTAADLDVDGSTTTAALTWKAIAAVVASSAVIALRVVKCCSMSSHSPSVRGRGRLRFVRS
jgi:hypothetical protein